MKKEKIMVLLLVILIISNIISWIVLISEINDVERIYFEEKVLFGPTGVTESTESFCIDLCSEKGYDGWRGGGPTEDNQFSCICYKLVH